MNDEEETRHTAVLRPVVDQEETLVIDLHSDLEIYTIHIAASAIAEALQSELHEGADHNKEKRDIVYRHLVLNLTDIDFIDSVGFGLIVETSRKMAERSGSLRLFGLAPQVARVFTLSRMDKLVPTHRTEAEALEAVRVTARDPNQSAIRKRDKI